MKNLSFYFRSSYQGSPAIEGHFVKFSPSGPIVVITNYPSTAFRIEVVQHHYLVTGFIVITEEEFNAARNAVLFALGLADHDAQLLAQIEAHEAEEAAILPY